MARKLTNPKTIYMFLTELDLVHKYTERPFIWDINLSIDNLINSLINRTQKNEVINWGDFDDDERVQYFVSVIDLKPKAVIWLMHVRSSKHRMTKTLLRDIFKDLKDNGFDDIQFVSTNTQPSFKKWAASLGARPIAVNYQIKM